MQCTLETGLACPLTDVDFLILAKVDNKKLAYFFLQGFS